MYRNKAIILVLTVILLCGSCTNTRYLTDPVSIKRQQDMKANRTGVNVGDVGINFASMILAAALDIQYEAYSRERTFKRISIVNQSTDSLTVNMVTDIVWKETGYCDIMGIVLPPGAKQKLLVPYPAAYNVYFKSPYSEEEKLEIRTDNNLRQINLKPGMTIVHPE
ncbi:MAG TPA: hypothetical protein DCL77_17905 [Prolixibacteraceae bacterium]|jgi:hypothetical protein|nr:hypothetical protein [Prolixibacteraceae bacterium]